VCGQHRGRYLRHRRRRPETFNISTTTAFVVAGCGVTVAKHGNRSVSSKCGSADVLEALGVKLDLDPELVEEAVGEIGIGFLVCAPVTTVPCATRPRRARSRPAKHFQHAGAADQPGWRQLPALGVYAPELTEMFAQALRLLGSRRAYVVHGHDGLDEISVCAPTRVSELKDGQVRTFNLDPTAYFDQQAHAEDLAGGDPEANAAITTAVLTGEKGPRRNVVLLNAAAALVAGGKAEDIAEGLTLARTSIDDGAAKAKLDDLVRFTQANAPA
jgi:anthranilate phosphoribosyltransferase